MMQMKQIVSRSLREQWGRAALLVLFSAASVAASLLPPQLLRLLIDRNLNAGRMDGLRMLAAAYLAALLLIGVLDFAKGWLLTTLGQRVVRETRSAMLRKAGRIPLRYFSEHATGETVSRFTADAESINTLFADGLVSMAVDCLKIVGILVSIALFRLELALVALALIPILYAVTRVFQRGMRQAQTANLEQVGQVSNHVTESIKNVQMIKLYYKESYLEDRFCERLQQNYRTRQRVARYDSWYAPIVQLIRAAAIAIVVVLSGAHVFGITAGMLAASIDLLSSLLSPIESLGSEYQNIQQGLSGIRRIDAFLALPEDQKDESLTAAAVIGPERRVRIVFEHVSFAYEHGQDVLRQVSFTAEPCTSVTLAGRTGVGKTTLMKLILGMLIPDAGAVTLNGIPAQRVPDREKRQIFGYVEQSFQFVPGTVADQITLGDPGLSRAQVETACRFVGLDDEIRRLPGGYDAPAHAEDFSFGQRQLLSIARAIVTDPPVLLLDEITANLDSATEERVVGVLSRACADRTILSISHRATSILHCDKLVYLEAGHVRAQGVPAEVLTQI